MVRYKHMRRTRNLGESGLVSFMVTMIMMLVITLIVLGFATVSRRNGREALDRQLGVAAYYAAESGINDALTYLTNPANSSYFATADAANATKCNGAGSFVQTAGLTAAQSLDGTNVQYTCLLVNSHPKVLRLDNFATNEDNVWKLQEYGTTTDPIKTLTVSFKKDSGSTATPTCSETAAGQYRAPSARCNFGVLQMDVLNWDGTGASGGAGFFVNKTKSIFLQPGSANSPTQTIDFSNTALHSYRVRCLPTSGDCKATFTLSPTANMFFVRMNMLYLGTDQLTLTGKTQSGADVQFAGGQTVIDSTGRAQDEIRRLQVRVSPNGRDSLPFNALETTQDICKHFQAATGIDPTSTCEP